MSLYHSNIPEHFAAIGDESMNNTRDAMGALKRSINNLEGCVPSTTGTPIAAPSRVAEGADASQQTPPSVPYLDTYKIVERNNRASAYLDSKYLDDIKACENDLIKWGLFTVAVCFLAAVIVAANPLGWFL